MNKTILFGTLLVASVGAYAQESGETPKWEIGANYTYTRVNPGGALDSYNSNGGSGYVEYNFNKVFGLVADLGGSNVGNVNGVTLNNTTLNTCSARASTCGARASLTMCRRWWEASGFQTASTPEARQIR